MEKIKVIFLDLDGVLNVYCEDRDEFGCTFHSNFVDNLRKIINETDAKIVISSSWRKDGMKHMVDLWKFRNLPGEIIDVTPSLYLQKGGSIKFWNDKLNSKITPKIKGYSIPRGAEIEYWIKNESKNFGILEQYVILDDDSDMLFEQRNNFVKTSGNIKHEDCVDIGYGLTVKCAEKAIEILNRKDEEKS
jgi:histidinol phosphatase-like enzyme